MMTCSICNRAGNDVKEYKSTLYNKMVPYCLDCLRSGREPYDDLVSFGWDFGWFNNNYQQKIIYPTLAFYNKTVQQFNEDIQKRREKPSE